MTIEEAIQHCREVAEKKSQFCEDFERSCGNEHKQLAKWLEELKVLREESAELKRLLMLAVEDIRQSDDFAKFCFYRSQLIACGECAKDCDFWKWKHADEVLKLIGGEKNV